MIIAGVYSKANSLDYKQLLSLNCADIDLSANFIWDNDCLRIIAYEQATRGVNEVIWHNAHSLLIGKVFSKHDYQLINYEDFRKISEYDACEHILNNFWGKYAYFKFNPTTRELIILGDFSQQLPIYYYEEQNGIILFSSDIKLLINMLGRQPDFNWHYLTSFLFYGNLLTVQTPFVGIKEIISGTSITLSPKNISEHIHWNPGVYTKQATNCKYFEEHLLATLQGVMHCYINQVDNIAIDFSGGLDSTILLLYVKMLANDGSHILPINISYPHISASNELEYARKITQEYGVELIEINMESCLPFSMHDPLKFIPDKPTMVFASLRREQSFYQETKEYSQCLYLNGHGGDSIFMAIAFQEYLVDYIMQYGLCGAHNKIYDLAFNRRNSIVLLWVAALKGLYRHVFKRNKKSTYNQIDAPWFSEEVKRYFVDDIRYSNFLHQHAMPPGKKIQLESIYTTLASINTHLREPNNQVIYPFLSQPLIEISLTLPTYESLKCNYTRYPIRKLIGEKFNTEAIWRQHKGEYSGALAIGLKQNMGKITEMCMDGVAARNRLINREILYKSIKDISQGVTTYQWALIYLVSLEMYLDYWRK